MGEVLSPKQAAKLLKLTTGTIYRWINEGKLAYTRLPSGYYRIPVEEIDRILTPLRANGTVNDDATGEPIEKTTGGAGLPPELF